MKTIANVINSIIKGAIISAFFLQFFLFVTICLFFRMNALSVIWGAINNLQLIIHLTLFQIKFPSNVFYLKMLLMEITNLELIPYTDSLDERWQRAMISEDDEGLLLNGIYNLLVYENCFYIYNLKDNLISFAISLLLICLYFAIKRLNSRLNEKQELPIKTVVI